MTGEKYYEARNCEEPRFSLISQLLRGCSSVKPCWWRTATTTSRCSFSRATKSPARPIVCVTSQNWPRPWKCDNPIFSLMPELCRHCSSLKPCWWRTGTTTSRCSFSRATKSPVRLALDFAGEKVSGPATVQMARFVLARSFLITLHSCWSTRCCYLTRNSSRFTTSKSCSVFIELIETFFGWNTTESYSQGVRSCCGHQWLVMTQVKAAS